MIASNLAAALVAAAHSAGPTTPCACPCSRPAPGPGLPGLLEAPGPEAFALNRQGRDLYRQRRFAEARQRYQAALEADPQFLGPRLNLACAFTQEQRFSEAVKEAGTLAQAGFVPWAREIREAADLAPLSTRPERRQLDDILAQAGWGWGASLRSALLFVGRMRTPVRLLPAGVLYLGLEQEIFAYLPASGRYRQVTAEDGRVLGFLRAPGADTLVYLRAGKLIRTQGTPDILRGVTIRQLHLPSMVLSPALALPGDFTRLVLRLLESGSSRIDLEGGPDGARAVIFDGHQLRVAGPADFRPSARARQLVLDGKGIAPQASQQHDLAGCRFTVRGVTGRGGSPPRLRVEPLTSRQAPFELAAPSGAGLRGLPFPPDRSSSATGRPPLGK